MKSQRLLTVLGALVLPLAVVAVSNGCKKDEEETPAPTTASAPAPTPTPTPTPVATIAPEEDAGTDAQVDADAAPKATGGGGDTTGIKKCCAALAQNAKTAPPEQQGAYQAAASACNNLVSSPQGRQALTALRGLLGSAKLPTACQ
jgi:hypothetical protein